MAQVAGQHGVFKVSATIPSQRVVTGMSEDKVLTKTLTTNDIVNLAQGRAIGTKFDAKHEVLAADVTFEDSGMGTPKSTVVIYDPTVGGSEGIKLVVAKLTEVQFMTAYTDAATKGFGVGKCVFNATTLGDPSKNALLSSTVTGQGSSTGKHIFNSQANTSATAACSFEGPIKFRFTDAKGVTTDWDGFALKAGARLSGKQIGNYVAP